MDFHVVQRVWIFSDDDWRQPSVRRVCSPCSTCPAALFIALSDALSIDRFKAVDIKFAGYETCRAAFNVSEDYAGPKRNAEELLANTEYGARALQGINITIPNGSMDPWHALGIVNQTDEFFSQSQRLSKQERVVFIKDTAHCRDMYAPAVFESIGIRDTEAVQWAHAKIRADVLGYLQ